MRWKRCFLFPGYQGGDERIKQKIGELQENISSCELEKLYVINKSHTQLITRGQQCWGPYPGSFIYFHLGEIQLPWEGGKGKPNRTIEYMHTKQNNRRHRVQQQKAVHNPRHSQ